MSFAELQNPIFTDENAAREALEAIRWPNGPVCPHCGSVREHYFLKPANGKSRKTRTGAPSERRVWKCADCRKQFTALTGTIMDASHAAVVGAHVKVVFRE